MRRCTTCLYPETKPDLHFDENGECSACRNYKDREVVDWDARFDKLLELLDKHDGRVLVPSSGGKDSTAQAMRLKDVGADVTVVTAGTDLLTPMGRKNIENLSNHVRTYEFTPNRATRGKLCRLGLEWVGDCSWPEHVLIHRMPFTMAKTLGIGLIMYGECPNNQYGGPVGTSDTQQMTQRWVSEFGGFLGLRAEDFVGHEGITERDMADYETLDDKELKKSKIEAHFLGWFEPWDSHHNAARALAAGMSQGRPYAGSVWPAENLDNALTGLHDHGMYRKFGYGRACAQLSVDIRMNRIARDSAYAIVRDCDGYFPWIYADVRIEETLEFLGMSLKSLFETLDEHTNWELFSDTIVEGRPILSEFGL
jgi:N-acetyl sugar amidotransferase